MVIESSPFCSGSLSSLSHNINKHAMFGHRSVDRQQKSSHQMLVRFENRTHVISIPYFSVNNKNNEFNIGCFIREKISDWSGWPVERLEITTKINNTNPPFPSFCTVRVISCIVGGKGGFGTLLKGQSRQAGAKSTTNFSACRDLQGRRLQHINYKVQYTLWKEWNEKVEAGTATTEQMIEAMLLTSTPTGVNGWYLPSLPTWADVSAKKESLKSRRIFHQWKRQMKYNENLKNQQREEKQAQIDSYVRASEKVTEQITNTLQSAFLKGLKKQQQQAQTQPTRKRSLQEMTMTSSKQSSEVTNDIDSITNEAKEELLDDENQIVTDSSSSLVTLSGDFVIEYDSKSDAKLQSKSNFATVVVLVDPIKVSSNGASCYYYEVSLVTNGVVQIGWSILDKFKPNSETGDGVGDCPYSWSIDISRCIKLHNNKTEPYERLESEDSKQRVDNNKQKHEEAVASTVSHDKFQTSEDTTPTVVGCKWNVQTSELSFSVDGNSWGKAFHVETSEESNDSKDSIANGTIEQQQTQAFCLYPSISCNENEIIELRWSDSQLRYKPDDAIAMGEVVLVENDVDTSGKAPSNGSRDLVEDKSAAKNDQSSKIDHSDTPNGGSLQNSETTPTEEDSSIDVNEYNTVEELEKLGLDRLKNTLQREGIKCGGTLQERAERLFSLKGLSPDEYPAKLRVTKKK